MTNKKLALLSFGIPFFLGGSFYGMGILMDQLQHPDDEMGGIILRSLWVGVSSGIKLGLVSLFVVLSVAAIFKILKK